MAIIPVSKDDVEHFTIITTPRRHYTSQYSKTIFGVLSTTPDITGSVKVYPRVSSSEKDLQGSVSFSDLSNNTWQGSAKEAHNQFKQKAFNARTSSAKPSIYSLLDKYMSLSFSSSVKANTTLEIRRFVPTTGSFGPDFLSKTIIKDILMPKYRVQYPTANWAYTNYHSLNFFTTSSVSNLVPTSSVFLYPNIVNSLLSPQAGHVSGTYCLTGAFSFDFHINPKYQVDGLDQGHFKDGTIFHLSSSYALSLVTGSSKDPRGVTNGYRLKLQLSHSADIAPSKALQGLFPNDLVFLSDDNSLAHNSWHHVVIRWGTNTVNDGTGSFIVDGINRGNFVIPSGTINPKVFTQTADPRALCVGNYYEGKNSGLSSQEYFFSNSAKLNFGVEKLIESSNLDPSVYPRFRHPLKAEVHDLSIRRYYMLDSEIKESGSTGLGSRAKDPLKIAFYVPPFFTESGSYRTRNASNINVISGIPLTPSIRKTGASFEPFSTQLAFGTAGHYISLENFTKDFVNNSSPRMLDLSGSYLATSEGTTAPGDPSYWLHFQKGILKRNLSILPCDDGKFDPNYSLLRLESSNYQSRFVDDYGQIDYSLISLKDFRLTLKNAQQNKEGLRSIYGATPEYTRAGVKINWLDVENASSSDVYAKIADKSYPLSDLLQDASSNQVVIFNISNLYYGKRILPGSFELKDSNLYQSTTSTVSGDVTSAGIKITLKDDGLGNLYRADSLTAHASQNSVGNIFYDEGVVLIKNPHLYFFGKTQYEISFKGVSEIYSSKYEILAGAGQLNSSSNPTYALNQSTMKASGDPEDQDKFVYISTINFHDENMNVIARAKLAQPIIKRNADKILFKVAFDT